MKSTQIKESELVIEVYNQIFLNFRDSISNNKTPRVTCKPEFNLKDLMKDIQHLEKPKVIAILAQAVFSVIGKKYERGEKRKNDSEKVSSVSTILESLNEFPEIQKCTNKTFICVFATNLFLNRNDVWRANLIKLILNSDESLSLKNILDESVKVLAELKSQESISVNFPESTYREIILALLRVAEFYNKPLFSSTALELNDEVFVECCKKEYANIYPYHALLHIYMANDVKPIERIEERERLKILFKQNPQAAVNLLCDNYLKHKVIKRNEILNKTTNKLDKMFTSDCWVYKRNSQYQDKLKTVTEVYDDKMFIVVKLDTCVFDVLGDQHRMYNDKPWNERMDMINCVDKVLIEKMTSDQIKKLYKKNKTLYFTSSPCEGPVMSQHSKIICSKKIKLEEQNKPNLN